MMIMAQQGVPFGQLPSRVALELWDCFAVVFSSTMYFSCLSFPACNVFVICLVASCGTCQAPLHVPSKVYVRGPQPSVNWLCVVSVLVRSVSLNDGHVMFVYIPTCDKQGCPPRAS
mmetsp:Transcript_15747/g.35320  ORF Transcript_15747/g.35320 Transcript_15747/m.35320 type:complete len:116 (-) Transcript_15747:49-396(-)